MGVGGENGRAVAECITSMCDSVPRLEVLCVYICRDSHILLCTYLCMHEYLYVCVALDHCRMRRVYVWFCSTHWGVKSVSVSCVQIFTYICVCVCVLDHDSAVCGVRRVYVWFHRFTRFCKIAFSEFKAIILAHFGQFWSLWIQKIRFCKTG
jgi:hypothetical protein